MTGKASFSNIPRLGTASRILGTSNILIALVLVLGMYGCAYPVKNTLPCPDRPVLMDIPVDLQIQMPPEAVWIVAENQLALKAHIKKLEARACN